MEKKEDLEIALIRYNKKTWCKSALLGFFVGLAVIVPRHQRFHGRHHLPAVRSVSVRARESLPAVQEVLFLPAAHRHRHRHRTAARVYRGGKAARRPALRGGGAVRGFDVRLFSRRQRRIEGGEDDGKADRPARRRRAYSHRDRRPFRRPQRFGGGDGQRLCGRPRLADYRLQSPSAMSWV